ncbi:hypothetical protein [Ekhidna sp. To15]|uniref:hypothetical protein n=1 Tax=Ekhidna sp. To15 TaxID=3395267 RepID=UPI003F522F91
MDEKPLDLKERELQIIQLESENELLRLEIESKSKRPSKTDRFTGFFKKWAGVIVTFFSLIGGLWGVFLPIKSYYEEKSKQLQYELNGSMISIVEGLYDKDPIKKNGAVVLLSYYEENALPILLHNLETSDETENEVITTVSKIYKRKSATVFNELTSVFGEFFRKEFQDDDLKIQMRGLLNYSRLFSKLDLNEAHRNELKAIKDKLDSVLIVRILDPQVFYANSRDLRDDILFLYQENPTSTINPICETIEALLSNEANKNPSDYDPNILAYPATLKYINIRSEDTTKVVSSLERVIKLFTDQIENDSTTNAEFYNDKLVETRKSFSSSKR